jgi:ABC-type antimicrobial peptide transport system permease subunit
MVLVDAAAVVALGVLTGGTLAYAGSRLLASRLYGVGPQDPLTVAFATGVLLAVAFGASYVPAARASKTDPLTLLR